MENARHALELVLRSEAKDIREKYVEPPYTTAFGILFLPFEGLYAEVVNAGLLEVLQRDYQVNVAGPSTMAALLNSLQMGFKTLAIQKRSGEVWQLLGAVKTEFDKFGQGLSKMQQRLRQTDEELDNLIGVRSRAITASCVRCRRWTRTPLPPCWTGHRAGQTGNSTSAGERGRALMRRSSPHYPLRNF